LIPTLDKSEALEIEEKTGLSIPPSEQENRDFSLGSGSFGKIILAFREDKNNL